MSAVEMDCDELVELVTAYLDGALDPETRGRFETHLSECDGCENYLQQFSSTVGLLGGLRETLDPVVRERLLAAFRDWTSPTGLPYYAVVAAAIAAMSSGRTRQQPPTIRAPAATHSAARPVSMPGVPTQTRFAPSHTSPLLG